MTYRTGHPTLRGVISQIERTDNITESPAIENNKRGVRLSKGKGAAGEVIYHIHTRPTTDKRIEWNFAARIAQERALSSRRRSTTGAAGRASGGSSPEAWAPMTSSSIRGSMPDNS